MLETLHVCVRGVRIFLRECFHIPRYALPEFRAGSAEYGSVNCSANPFPQANSVASLGRLYSDLDSGDDEESQYSGTIDKTMRTADEVDESKFFAGVFTSQRSEEDLLEYVNNILNC